MNIKSIISSNNNDMLYVEKVLLGKKNNQNNIIYNRDPGLCIGDRKIINSDGTTTELNIQFPTEMSQVDLIINEIFEYSSYYSYYTLSSFNNSIKDIFYGTNSFFAISQLSCRWIRNDDDSTISTEDFLYIMESENCEDWNFCSLLSLEDEIVNTASPIVTCSINYSKLILKTANTSNYLHCYDINKKIYNKYKIENYDYKTNGSITELYYKNGLYIFVTSNGYIGYSNDIINWNISKLEGNYSIHGIAFHNNQFYILCNCCHPCDFNSPMLKWETNTYCKIIDINIEGICEKKSILLCTCIHDTKATSTDDNYYYSTYHGCVQIINNKIFIIAEYSPFYGSGKYFYIDDKTNESHEIDIFVGCQKNSIFFADKRALAYDRKNKLLITSGGIAYSFEVIKNQETDNISITEEFVWNDTTNKFYPVVYSCKYQEV